ncbi:unnamed protein product [Gongylonema pulchrum]|uniref:Glutathione peroxidase n=1 Tax=Gongylonema pulchrum TaxID=637853 RepID=A0A3P7LQ59_9BILA|nr:unnamed protein product [Gongylonema pulchrum]
MFRGKVVLIVNVASECGLTNTNYNQLKQLYDKYSSRGLAIAAFPCNQFGGQPDLYAKVDVNGPTEHPLYAFLKEQQGGTLGDDIKWNFTKFLVDRNGQVVSRFINAFPCF